MTAFYLFSVVFALYGWYLSTTRDSYFFDGAWIAVVHFVVALVRGLAWDRYNPATHRKRVEVLVWLLVVGFVPPMVFYLTLSILGASTFDLPFFVVPVVSYVATLLIAYGAVYGLDFHLFSRERRCRRVIGLIRLFADQHSRTISLTVSSEIDLHSSGHSLPRFGGVSPNVMG